MAEDEQWEVPGQETVYSDPIFLTQNTGYVVVLSGSGEMRDTSFLYRVENPTPQGFQPIQICAPWREHPIVTPTFIHSTTMSGYPREDISFGVCLICPTSGVPGFRLAIKGKGAKALTIGRPKGRHTP